jgi:hypothetical protein
MLLMYFGSCNCVDIEVTSIGTALATNPSLRREDLMMVAVLAIPLPNDGPVTSTPQQLPSPPPGPNQVICTVIGPRDDLGKETSVFFSEVANWEMNVAHHGSTSERTSTCF